MSRTSPAGPKYYTTHGVARLLGVSLPTVVNWADSGLLEVHRTPGGHRRISREALVTFSKKHEYPLPPEEFGGSGPPRVLVVDDDTDFGQMVIDYIALKSDYEVCLADSGFAAGLAVAEFKPNLILMDLMMPGMDGFEAARALRQRKDQRQIPIIACTGHGDPAVERRIEEEGFQGWIQKPLALEDLLGTIRRHLEAAGVSA